MDQIFVFKHIKFWVKITSRILGPNLVLGDGCLWGREEVMADSISKAHVLNRLLPPAGYYHYLVLGPGSLRCLVFEFSNQLVNSLFSYCCY